MINTMKQLLDDIKISNQNLEWINSYKEECYPIAYYKNKGQIELLEYLIPLLTDWEKEITLIEKVKWKSNVENLKQVNTNTNEIIDKINEIIDIINK